ncbi:hypothetical protein K438DRAFT_1772722 [Mycena galopus ATCC 62051]|nr:hypothetical protein K438DRAFT_1772722 [Mycena galopus ATCC 62051]
MTCAKILKSFIMQDAFNVRYGYLVMLPVPVAVRNEIVGKTVFCSLIQLLMQLVSNAALNSPELWPRITLHFARSIRPERVYLLPMLETHVLRSGATLLEMVSEVHGVNDYDKRMMELLRGHSRRWETFRLCVWGTSRGPLFNCLRPGKGNLPLVRSLEFTCTDDVAHRPALITSDVFSIAPNLKEVSFIRDSDPSSILMLTLTSSGGAGLNILKIVGPALVECAMTFTNGQQMTLNPRYPAIFLPKLRRLRLTTSGNFLNFIIAPRLEELWVSDTSLIPILEGRLTPTTLFVLLAPAVIRADELFEALMITGSPASVCPRSQPLAQEGSRGAIPSLS